MKTAVSAVLTTYKNVRTSIYHHAGTATVRVEIALPVGLKIVNKDRRTALGCYPRILIAARDVRSRVRDSKGRQLVNNDILRTCDSRTSAVVRAAALAVHIRRDVRAIREPRLSFQRG